MYYIDEPVGGGTNLLLRTTVYTYSYIIVVYATLINSMQLLRYALFDIQHNELKRQRRVKAIILINYSDNDK